MGHLFEKRKICHSCQGNYHSERKGGGGVAGCGRKEKKVQQLLWTELDFGGILSLQDKQKQGLFFLSFLPSFFSLSLISHSTFPVALYRLFSCSHSHIPPSLFSFLPPLFSLPLSFMLQHHHKYQCEICLQLKA